MFFSDDSTVSKMSVMMKTKVCNATTADLGTTETSVMEGHTKMVMAVVSLEDAMASANALEATALLEPDQHIQTKICVRETARMYESLVLGKTNTKTSLSTMRKTGIDAAPVVETNAAFSVSDLRMRFEGVQGPLAVRESESKSTTSKHGLCRSRYDVYGVSVYEDEKNDTEDEVNVEVGVEEDVVEVVEEDVVDENEICQAPPQSMEKSSCTSVEKDDVPSAESTCTDEEAVALYAVKLVAGIPTAAIVPVPVLARAILPSMTMDLMRMLMVFFHFMIRVIAKVGLKTVLWMVSTAWWLVVSMGRWMIASLAPAVVAGGLLPVSMAVMTCLVDGFKWCTRKVLVLMTTMSKWLSLGWRVTSLGLVEVWHGMIEGGRRTKLWLVGTWASMKAMALALWLWLEVAYVAMWFCWFVMAQIVRFECVQVEKKVSMMVQEARAGSSASAVMLEKKRSDDVDLKDDMSSEVETDSDTETEYRTESVSESESESESEGSSEPLNETKADTEPMEPTMDKVTMDLGRLTQPWTHAITNITMDMTAETNEVYKVHDEVIVEWCPLPPSDQHAALGRGSIDTVGCDCTVSVGVFVVVDGVEVTSASVGEASGGSIGSGCGSGSLEFVNLPELPNEIHGPAEVDMDAFSSPSPSRVVSSSSSSSSASSPVGDLAPSSSPDLSAIATIETAVEFTTVEVEVEFASHSALETEVGLIEVDASPEVAPRASAVTSSTTETETEAELELELDLEREREPVPVTRATSVDTSVSSQSARGRTTKRKEVTSLYLLYKTHSKSYQRNVDGSLAQRKALEAAKLKDHGSGPRWM